MRTKFGYTRENRDNNIKQVLRDIKMDKLSFLLYFVTGKMDFDKVTKLVNEEYPDVPNIGCVSTGEITPEGYIEGSFSIIAVYSEDFVVEPIILTRLNKRVMLYKRRVLRALNKVGIDINRPRDYEKFFMIALTDAFAACEERFGTLCRTIFGERDFNLVGGSAGDLATKSGKVAVNGRVESASTALLIVKTDKKVRVYKENIYVPTGKSHRVTDSDFETRTVKTVDKEKFRDLYAREIGIPPTALNSNVFAQHPIGRISKGEAFIASPLKVNNDGSITFYSKVLTGSQFYFMKSVSMEEKAKETHNLVMNGMKSPELILGFNCILRYLQMKTDKTCKSLYSTLSRQVPYYGFTTLGEQIGNQFSNQTLVVLVIGE